MTFAKPGSILKVQVSDEPVQVRDPKTVLEEAHSEAERLVREAREAADRIRRTALDAAARERESARTEAARIVAEASNRRDAVYEEARGTARAEAEAALRESLLPRLELAVADFEQLVRTGKDAFDSFLESQRDDVVAFALEIAHAVVQHLSESDRELAVRCARAAIERASERRDLILRVHPEDLRVVEEFRSELIHRFDDLKTLTLEADGRVDRGGVWIETPSGFIDGRIRTQMEEILRSVVPEKE